MTILLSSVDYNLLNEIKIATIEYKCELLNINMPAAKYKREPLNLKMSSVSNKWEPSNLKLCRWNEIQTIQYILLWTVAYYDEALI